MRTNVGNFFAGQASCQVTSVRPASSGRRLAQISGVIVAADVIFFVNSVDELPAAQQSATNVVASLQTAPQRSTVFQNLLPAGVTEPIGLVSSETTTVPQQITIASVPDPTPAPTATPAPTPTTTPSVPEPTPTTAPAVPVPTPEPTTTPAPVTTLAPVPVPVPVPVSNSPSAPQSVTAVFPPSGVCTYYVAVAWSAPASAGSSAITGYDVICTSSNGGSTASGTTTSLSLDVGPVTLGKDYTCSVSAKNAVGTSNPGTVTSFTIA